MIILRFITFYCLIYVKLFNITTYMKEKNIFVLLISALAAVVALTLGTIGIALNTARKRVKKVVQEFGLSRYNEVARKAKKDGLIKEDGTLDSIEEIKHLKKKQLRTVLNIIELSLNGKVQVPLRDEKGHYIKATVNAPAAETEQTPADPKPTE